MKLSFQILFCLSGQRLGNLRKPATHRRINYSVTRSNLKTANQRLIHSGLNTNGFCPYGASSTSTLKAEPRRPLSGNALVIVTSNAFSP